VTGVSCSTSFFKLLTALLVFMYILRLFVFSEFIPQGCATTSHDEMVTLMSRLCESSIGLNYGCLSRCFVASLGEITGVYILAVITGCFCVVL